MHQHPAPHQQTPCVTCTRPVPAWDPRRFACPGCQSAAADRLAELPGLYAALPTAWQPGSTSGGGGARTVAGPREPLRLGPLSLAAAGGVPTVLQMRMEDWAEQAGRPAPWWRGPDTRRVADACRQLRWHLDWACRSHPAIDEALREIAEVHGAVRGAVTGERGERVVRVQCPCGGVLRVTVSTSGAGCGACGARYGRAEALGLPLAPRAAPAAA